MTTFAPPFQSFSSTQFNPFKKKIQDTTSAYASVYSPASKPYDFSQAKSTPQPYDFSQAKSVYTPPPVPAPKPVPTSADNYLSETNKVALEQQQFLENQAKNSEATANRIYNQKITTANAQAPLAQQAYDQFKTDTTAGATTAKANAETQWGNDQRLLAQTRQETAGRLGNKFAAQNTSDSFGAGSAQQTNTNLESDFNRQTAQGLQAKSNNLTNIDQNANSLIAQEGIKLKQNLLAIQNTVFSTEEERAAAVTKAYDDAKAGMLGIQENLANLKYQKALSDEQIAKTSETAGLSNGFLKSGIPETAADFVFKAKNPTAFSTQIGASATANGQNKVLDMVNKVLGADTKPITGFNRIVVPGTSGAVTQADWQGLKSLLTLASRGQLKGQGQVSDMETRMLEKASAAGLDVNMPDDVFRQRLEALKQDLVTGGATAMSSSPNQMIRVQQRSTGQTGQIPSSEFDPALYVQIQ